MICSLIAAARSDPGRQREINEDQIVSDPNRGIFAVIDGVGGHAAGEVAANIARDRLLRVLGKTLADPSTRLREALTLANNAIYQRAQAQPEMHDMACVATVALIEGDRLTVGHVGDTRIYKVVGGRIDQISHDHSPVGEREAEGRLTEIEAMQHPRRNEIYRDIGSEMHDTEDDDFIDIYHQAFEADCALVLCSDGLTDLVPSTRIREVVESHAGAPEASVDQLIAEANDLGGKDNISVIVIEAEDFASPYANANQITRQFPTAYAAQAAKRRWWPPFSRPRKQQESAVPKAAIAPTGHPPARRRRLGPAFTVLLMILVALLAMNSLRLGRQLNQLSDLVAAGAPPAVIRVGPGDSISAALAQARPGQIVEVAPVEYQERIVLPTGVSLISRPAGASLHIQATDGSSDPLVAVTAIGAHGARIDGFRIVATEEHPIRIGIRLVGSSVEVERLEISGATVAAIESSDGDRSTVRLSNLHNNTGAGLRVLGGSALRMVQSLITDNAGPGIEIDSGSLPVLAGNHLLVNAGGAIVAADKGREREFKRWNHFGKTAAKDRFRIAAPPGD